MRLPAYLVVAGLLVAAWPIAASANERGPVGVGGEPIVRVAPDGTVYVAAYQILYRSEDRGSSWTVVSPSPYASPLNLGTDSSLDISPDGSRIAMAFDWPSLGPTAVCESTTRGDSWTCNPVAVPGRTDRMWIHYLPDGRLFLLTDVYDAGLTYTAVQLAPGSPAFLVTPYQMGWYGQWADFTQGWGPTRHDGELSIGAAYGPWMMAQFDESGTPLANMSGQSLPFVSTSISSTARDGQGNRYGTTLSGSELRLVQYNGTVGNLQWRTTPIVAGGNLAFAAIAAGATGRVTVLFYWAPRGDEQWQVFAADSWNANSAAPTFALTQLSSGVVHSGTLCYASGCLGQARFAGDFLSATFDDDGHAWWAWVEDAGSGGTVHVDSETPTTGSPAIVESAPYGTTLRCGPGCTLDIEPPCGSPCVSLPIPNGSTRVALELQDTISPYVTADVCFESGCPVPTTICRSAELAIPSGAARIYVSPGMRAVDPGGPCGVEGVAPTTTGEVVAAFR